MMLYKSSFACFLVLALSTPAARAARVIFYTERSCGSGGSYEFRDPGCNKCFDPPGDWYAVQFSEIGSNQRVSIHNQDRCTTASSTGQTFGPVCYSAGRTGLRSAWVACAGQKFGANGTEAADTSAVPTVVADDDA